MMTDPANAQSVTVHDVMDPARAAALQASLGHPSTLSDGDALPPFFHQIYFWSALPPENLGRDGHPARGQAPIPDMGLPRRMWAGGRLSFHSPLLLGKNASCTAACISSRRKEGRTGSLGLITLRLNYRQDGIRCLTEERDLIYRQDADPNAPKPIAPTPPDVTPDMSRPLTFNPTLLFRYSALTFNGHRIHYDLPYARDIEGYDGLVVHGPLLAQQLMLLAEDALGPLHSFSFRATAPLMDWESATAHISSTTLWIEGPDGRQCMIAQAKPV